MRYFVCLMGALLGVQNAFAVSLVVPEKVEGETCIPILVTPKTDAKSVKWVMLDKGLFQFPSDMLKDEKTLLVFARRAGSYRVACVAAGADGTMAGPVICTVVVKGDEPPASSPAPPAPPAPSDKANPTAATVQYLMPGGRCTATVIGPRRSDGRWDVLSAGHCSAKVGNTGTIKTKDGRSLAVRVVSIDSKADVAWMVTDAADQALDFAELASSAPSAGTAVWHCGYGYDKPGNREAGIVRAGSWQGGVLPIDMSVSSGDSGAGVFEAKTGQLVGVVSGTTSMARKGLMFAGSVMAARAIRPGKTDDVAPCPLPEWSVEGDARATSSAPARGLAALYVVSSRRSTRFTSAS